MEKLLICLCFITTMAHAEDNHVFYDDWEVVCDNTRTCRAAGYTVDEDERQASLLLTRKAGQGQRFTADMRFADARYGERDLPDTGTLLIDDQYAGPLHFDDTEEARLTPRQTQSVLKAIKARLPIGMKSADHASLISNEGSHAALLKMEAVQRRLGTTSSIIWRGTQTDVLPAVPVPVIERKPMYSTEVLEVLTWNRTIDVAALKKELLTKIGDRCDFTDLERDTFEPKVEAQLTPDALLVSAPCPHSIHRYYMSVWRIHTQPPYDPEEITLSASELDQGDIVSDFFGKGTGGCLTHRQWTWTGNTFALTSDYSGGMCRLVLAGGAWVLATYVSEVR